MANGVFVARPGELLVELFDDALLSPEDLAAAGSTAGTGGVIQRVGAIHENDNLAEVVGDGAEGALVDQSLIEIQAWGLLAGVGEDGYGALPALTSAPQIHPRRVDAAPHDETVMTHRLERSMLAPLRRT